MQTTTETVTVEQLQDLSREAAAAGDTGMQTAAQQAWVGLDQAGQYGRMTETEQASLRECVEAIREAEAQQ